MADETTVANRKWKLIFIAIHGLGPQPEPPPGKKSIRDNFLDKVKNQAKKGLTDDGVINNYIGIAPDWSHDFRNASDSWLYSQIYDNLDWDEFNAGIEDSTTRELMRKIKSAEDRIDFPTLREYYIGAKGGDDFATLGPGVPAKNLKKSPRGKVISGMTSIHMDHSLDQILDKLPSIAGAILNWASQVGLPIMIFLLILFLACDLFRGWICTLEYCGLQHGIINIIISFCFVVLLVLAFSSLGLFRRFTSKSSIRNILGKLSIVGESFPWSNLFNIGRPFEAHSISDIMLYSSPSPRFRILSTIIDSLKVEIEDTAPDTDIYLVLGGHSLGSVIAYDLLRAWIVLSNQDGTVVRGIQDETKPILVEGFREKAADLVDRVQPVGLVTFGSPVSLFMFRKPDLFSRLDLWNELCPARYRDSQGFNPVDPATDLQWRWMNFWHASDFVAHRLGPFFNTSAVAGNRIFVEDIETSRETPEPISAHSTYWVDGQVHREIGSYIRDCLMKLNKHHGAGSQTAG